MILYDDVMGRIKTPYSWVNSRDSYLNGWENTHVTQALISISLWNTCWRHGRSRGETKVWLKDGFTRQPFHTTSISFTTLTGCAECTVIQWEVDLINTIQTPSHLATDDTVFFDVVYPFQITDLQQNETILEKDSCIMSFSLESFYEDISLYSKMNKTY